MNEYTRIDRDHFVVSYDGANNFGTPMEEFQKIAAKMPDRVTVLCSGGIDSEAMARLLAKCGKEVTAVAYILVYQDKNVNEHDLKWVEGLRGVPNIRVTYQYFHLDWFWKSSWFWNFFKQFKCTSPQMALQSMLTLEQSLGSFTVLPAIHPEPKMWGDEVVVQIREKDFATLRCLKYQNCMVSPLQSNASMYASLLSSNEFQNFASFGLQDGRDRKPEQYKEWFDLDLQRRPKYHGFEMIQEEENQIRKEIYNRFGYSESWMFVPVDILLRNFKRGSTAYGSQYQYNIIEKGAYTL